MYLENMRVIHPSGQMLFSIESYKVKSEHQPSAVLHKHVNCSKDKRSMGNHKIAAKQVNSL